jgi:hypothetical protein
MQDPGNGLPRRPFAGSWVNKPSYSPNETH